MTEAQLLKLGFKKKKFDQDYWFELKKDEHLFITNDTNFNNRKDEWHIGWEGPHFVEPFWFKNRVNTVSRFNLLFKVAAAEF